MRGMRRLVADATDKIKMYYVKTHSCGAEVVVACCDADLLGKTLKADDFELSITERFFAGQRMSEEDAANQLAEATSANIIGDAAVGFALRRGIISESGVKEVCGLRHAQIFLMR
jgi:uncharacterized protein